MAKLNGISEACQDEHRKADVVFIHGLGGDAFGTWRHGEGEDTSWPHWLAEDFPDIGVWSLEHAADPSKPLGFLSRLLGKGGRDAGQGMSLPDRAGQILDLMRLDKHFRGERPIVFVCHSLGGLLAKQMLRQAHDNAGNTDAESINRRTAGVLFLATPHNGAGLATLADKFAAICGPTASLKALEAHDPHLRNLYNWYRNHAPRLGIETETYYEGHDVFGLRIVDETSSQPGVGPDAVMLDEDHLSIAKPREPDAQVCRALEEMLRKVARTNPSSAAGAKPRSASRVALQPRVHDPQQGTSGQGKTRQATSNQGKGMTAQFGDAKRGAPSWNYIVGALVAVAGLVWGIVSVLNSRPEPMPAPPPMQRAEPSVTSPSVQRTEPSAAAPSVQRAESSATPLPVRRTEPPAAAPPMQRAEAHGGTAINASGNAQVSVGAVSAPEAAEPVATDTPLSESAVQPAQDAKAGPGGTAINASGNAKVKVETSTQPQP